MEEALLEARIALENGEFPVGCVLVSRGRIVARGARLSSNGSMVNEIDHAEIRALYQLTRSEEPIDPSGITLYSTLEPCLMCFSAIMLAGIRRVVFAYEDVMGGGTCIDRNQLAPLYRNASMVVSAGLCREKSVDLFKKFFLDMKSPYLKGTYLAEYTLRQQASVVNDPFFS